MWRVEHLFLRRSVIGTLYGISSLREKMVPWNLSFTDRLGVVVFPDVHVILSRFYMSDAGVKI